MSDKILVVGALHWDVIVDAARLPRLDETLFGRGVTYRLGGKGGNQAIAAAKAGVSVSFLGRLGMDAAGDSMRVTLEEAGVDVAHLQTGQGASGMSVAIVDAKGDYGAVVVSAENANIALHELDRLDHYSIVLCQNELPAAVLTHLTNHKTKCGFSFWLNLAPATELPNEILDAVDVLIVNRLEAADLLYVAPHALAAEEMAQRLTAKHPKTTVLVTVGSDGVVFCEPGNEAQHLPADRIDDAVSHGAGDHFIGTLAAAKLENATWPNAIAFAQAETARFLAKRVT